MRKKKKHKKYNNGLSIIIKNEEDLYWFMTPIKNTVHRTNQFKTLIRN